MYQGRQRNWPLLSLAALIAILLTQFHKSECLRTGAPALACINLRPFHGLHRAKPASASQFFVTQSSLTYAPGQNVTVDIITHSNERYFRGFIIQAYDPVSGSQIGHFKVTNESRPIDSCSASTHRNNLNKKHVTLIWLPPDSAYDASVANQWLGLPASPQSGGFGSFQPAMSFSMSKRQLNNGVQPVTPATTVSPTAASGANQVRFRATIVVTYEEFYTGFESSDRSFEKWDYASGSGMRPDSS